MSRVLSVIHYPVFGGPHNQALRLADPLRAKDWETLVLLPDEPGGAASRLTDAGIEVVTMPLHRLRSTVRPEPHLKLVGGFGREIAAIRHLIRERAVDLVQLNGLVNPHAAIAARLEGIPVVWQLLDTRAPWAVAVVSMAFVRLLAGAVMSTGTATALMHPGGAGLRGRLFPYFPPVDTDLFRPRPLQRREVRLDWGVADESPVVGCVANLNPQKGIVDLVRAFGLVQRARPDARLVLVGAEHSTHGAYSAEIRSAIQASGMVEGRDVRFAGARGDVERQLAGLDLFAFAPSPRGEGVSTVVLEAMASGLPVVSTNVAGLGEAIDDGRNGRLVPPQDPDAMAEAINHLLSEPRLAGAMGAQARETALKRFTVARCATIHAAAYEFAMRARSSA